MVVPIGIGIGDGYAIFEICQKLTTFVADFRLAPNEYQRSVECLRSKHETLAYMAEQCEQWSRNDCAAVVNGYSDVLQRLLYELRQTMSALKETEDMLVHGYAVDANALGLRRWRPRLRWPNTRSKVDKSFKNVLRHLSCAQEIMMTMNT